MQAAVVQVDPGVVAAEDPQRRCLDRPADGNRNLSASLPRTSADVEEWMGSRIGG